MAKKTSKSSKKSSSKNANNKIKKVSKNTSSQSKNTKKNSQINKNPSLEKLHELAVKAANMSYSPYSKFAVGCVIVGANGKLYTGCNVENAVNGMSLCAEGTSIVKMVQDGCRQIKEVYVVTKLSGNDISGPCGLCRQHIKEFSKDDAKLNIHIGSFKKGYEITYSLRHLFPCSFGPSALTMK